MITLDSDAQRYLYLRQRESALSQMDAATPEKLRAEERRLRERYGTGPSMVSELLVPARGSLPKHYILNPSKESERVLIYFHGGGWVMGEPEDYLAVCRALAAASGWSVVVADYRKAPENPFPAAFEDAIALVEKFASSASARAEASSIGIGGDSAGGNLAAAVSTHFAIHRPEVLAVQVLITPVLDTDLNTPSYLDPERQLTLTRENMAWFLSQYVSAADYEDWRVAPLRVPEPANLPPTILVAVTSDVLFSETQSYLSRLKHAGVPVLYREYPGQLHGFYQLYNVMSTSKEAVKWISSCLNNVARKAALAE